MKYWEIIADHLSAAGWTWGYSTVLTTRGVLHVVDACRRGAPRMIVRSDEKLSAFLEIERMTNDSSVPGSATNGQFWR
ncbi:MAG TPA: hypothetical protein VIW07_13280 [Candidatus Udaeobacter sp.]|jgi:hypothetical protein